MYENQLILTGIILSLIVFFYIILTYLIKKSRGKIINSAAHFKKIKKTVRFILGIFAVISITFVWGVNIQGIWGTLTGVLALVAIGLFAVWSLLSNIVASILIFTTKPFKINDTIEVLPENIKGRVKEIGLIFVTLEDKEKNIFKVPNNLIFQKYVKVSRN